MRLDSLKNAQPRPRPRFKAREVPDSCPNPECSCTEIINEDCKNICKDCGTVISEDDMITDMQYGLGAAGNHVIHGKHVGNDQAYNKDGDVFDRHRAMSSEELTNMRGKNLKDPNRSSSIDITKAGGIFEKSQTYWPWERRISNREPRYSN